MDEVIKQFCFNRRTVEDQLVYIQARSLKEAWARARADDADDTSDPRIVKTTYRIKDQSHGL